MRIALIYEFLSEQGGLEREIINHANFLKQEGHQVLILTCYKSKDINKILPFNDLNIQEISLIKTNFETINLILCFIGLNKLNKFNPDLFISYSAPSNFLIRNKKIKKVNYINHFPHFLYLKKDEKIEWAASTPGIKRWISVFLSWILGEKIKKIDKNLIRKNNLNFVNSEFTKKTIDSIYNLNSIVSYPPIDPRIKPFYSNIRNKELFIFSCGRLIPDKKYEWLIKSASFMKNKILIYLAGQGEKKYINSLKNLANNLEVKLVFLGKLNTEQIIKYYSSAELFAFPTPKEDFGLVPAESITCGTPCVIWGDGSGPTEQIIDEVNGFYAKPYDLKDFADKMDLCISKKFKEKNRNKIINSSKKFSAEIVKKDFLENINKIMN